MAEQKSLFSITNSSHIVLVLILILGVIAVFGAWFSNSATFRLNEVGDIVNPLTGLFVAALFMERIQEVIVKAWRQRDEQDHESKLSDAKQNLERADSDDNRKAVTDCEKILREYKNDTKNFAFGIGLLIGFFFSLVGVRCLAEIMDYENLVGFQAVLFEFVDFIVTAGVIAGGSDAVHKLISVFTDGFDTTRKLIKQSAEKQIPTPSQ